MPNSKIRVVIISPTYNEKGNIKKLCELLIGKIFSSLPPKYDPHILIVDDSSPDGTGNEVLALAKRYPNLHLFTNPTKMGLGNAYTKGMQYAAKELDADIMFQFDADFQHDPTRIPLMLSKLDEGYDVVLGARYIKGGSIPDTWGLHRKFFSVVGNMVIRIVITNFSIHDWTTGYRAIKRKVVDEILPALNNDTFMGYTFQIGFLHKAVRRGYRVAEVPLKFVDRTYGKSKLGAEYIKNTLFYIFKVRIFETLTSRVFKFAMVGALGTLVQMASLLLWRRLFSLPVANLLSIEMAIISNFIWNNVWTYADRRVTVPNLPRKFIEFNLASIGSIVIQEAVVIVADLLLGIFVVGKLGGIVIDSGHIYALIGILLGMIWNFFAYSKIVWKK